METIENKQLAAELQELYLQNKEWLLDVRFLEDETRVFEKLFDKVTTLAIHKGRTNEIHPVSKSLTALSERRQTLKALIIQHQHLLESLIKDQSKVIGIELIQENTQIIEHIKTLFLEEKTVRKDLYRMTEKVFDAENKNPLQNFYSIDETAGCVVSFHTSHYTRKIYRYRKV